MAFIPPILAAVGASAASTAGTMVGVGLSILSSVASMMAAKNQSSYQADVVNQQAAYNIQRAQVAGQVEKQEADVTSERIQDRAHRAASAARASFLSSGVTLEGSSLETLMDLQNQYTLEVLDAKRAGENAMLAAKNTAGMEGYQGQLAINEIKMRRNASLTRSAYNIGDTILTGAAKFNKKEAGV